MRRIVLAVALVAAMLGVVNSAVSRADAPPRIYFYDRLSDTPPTAGRNFTAIVVAHPRTPWTLSCSVTVQGHPLAAQQQDFDTHTVSGLARWHWRSCAFKVPRGTVGDVLSFTADLSDSTGNTRHDAWHWKIMRDAILRTPRLGHWAPSCCTQYFSTTQPAAGRPFTPVIVEMSDGGAWRLHCSALLSGHPLAVHRQEFDALPDLRTCGVSVPPGTAAGARLTVTVVTTDPKKPPRRHTHSWRIAG